MLKEASKMRRCPICGKPDWCCFVEKEDKPGKELVVCKRDVSECNVEGIDGLRYVYLSKTKNGSSLFEEFEQHMLEENSRRGHKEYVFEKKAVQRQLVPVNIVMPKGIEKLDPIYRFMQSQLSLDQCHRDYLKNQGWSDELIEYHKVKTMPEDDFLRTTYRNRYHTKSPTRKSMAITCEKEFGKECLLGVPGAYINQSAWTFYSRSGILFPMYDFDGKVKRLRLRMDFRDYSGTIFRDSNGVYYIKDSVRYYITMKGIHTISNGEKVYIKTKGKYRTLASFQQDEKAAEQGFFANELEKGCQSANEMSFYTRPGDNLSMMFVTEGEPKGMFANDKMKHPFITTSGVSSYQQTADPKVIQECIKRGMQMIVLATDADKYQNQKVMDAEDNLIKSWKSQGICVAVAEWDERKGKGIDDLLAGGNWPRIQPVI